MLVVRHCVDVHDGRTYTLVLPGMNFGEDGTQYDITTKRLGLLLGRFLKSREKLRRVIISVLTIHSAEALQNCLHGHATTHRNTYSFYESLFKQVN